MSRIVLLSVMAASLALAASADAANPVAKKKALLKDSTARRAAPSSAGDARRVDSIDADDPSEDVKPQKPLSRVHTHFAPADPLAGQALALPIAIESGPTTQAAPVDDDPINPSAGGGTVVICFTQDMLKRYLAWLGVDLDTALHYGLLDDARLISMFFDEMRRLARRHGADADAAGIDTFPYPTKSVR